MRRCRFFFVHIYEAEEPRQGVVVIILPGDIYMYLALIVIWLCKPDGTILAVVCTGILKEHSYWLSSLSVWKL
jgi:hypothetical protein